MGKGIRSLAETVDESEIVDLGEELNIPNIGITSEFGIAGKYGDFALVQKKISHRTGTEEDGVNNGKVIRYRTWMEVNPFTYGKTVFDMFDNYFRYTTLYKIKKLKFAGIEECKKIYTDVKNEIYKAIKGNKIDNQVKEYCDLLDEISKLKVKVQEAYAVIDEADKLKELIRTKRAIIINDTEPKKHREKKEEK